MSAPTLADLKERIDLRDLVAETHALGRNDKVLCPFHAEREPSCHIYPDGFKCFGCGAHGDHVTWLMRTRALDPAQAIREILAWAGHAPVRPRAALSSRPRPEAPIPDEALAAYQVKLRATHRLPRALAERGLSLTDALALGVAADREDAILPIAGPDGRILALKRRRWRAREGARYRYDTPGHGSPAWCAPEARSAPALLLIEGELNGMVAALALRAAGAAVGVVGVAGVHGALPAIPVAGKRVFLWADADAAGRAAAARWARALKRRGARPRALRMGPQDACEVAGAQGQLFLAAALLRAMRARPVGSRRVPDGSVHVA